MAYHCFSMKATVACAPRRCIWCYSAILAGSTYRRERSVYDGQFQNFSWHEACRSAADEHFNDTGEEDFTSGNEMPYQALYQLEATRPDLKQEAE